MHPITIPASELKPALTGLGKLVPRASALPAIQCIRIERTKEGWITLTASDGHQFATVRLEQPAQGANAVVLVPFEQLHDLAKNLNRQEQIQIEPHPHHPLIKFAVGDRLGESKIKPVPVDTFPAIPKLKSDPVVLPPAFRDYLREALECTSTDPTRCILHGAFIDVSQPKAHYVIGTDGKQLYAANSFQLPLKHSLIIPHHKFIEWKEFNQDGEWQLRADDVHVQLTSRRWRFISRQPEGHYPNWRLPIPEPSTAKTHITLNPVSVEALIKRLPCHDERFCSMGLEWKDGTLSLMGKDSNEEPWTRIPVSEAKGEGPYQTIFADRRLIVRALQFGLNTISIIDPLSPLRFHNAGRSLIVMPVRPDSASSPPHRSPQPAPASRPVPRPDPMPAAQPRNTMPPPPPPIENNPPPAIEAALELANTLRDSFQQGLNQIRDLSMKLRLIQREQRTNSREFNSVRSTLRSLQAVKL